ncbi:MAG: MMPL family transporter [Mycobacteriaceae bacterium]
MATYLYRLGKFVYRKKAVMLSLWLTVLALSIVGAATLSGETKDAFVIPGTPAQEAQDLMAERFPGAKDPFNSLSARFVFGAPAGQTLDSAENTAAMDKVLAEVRKLKGVSPQAQTATTGPEALLNPVVANANLVNHVTEETQKNGGSVSAAVKDAQAIAPLSVDKTVGYVEVPFVGSVSAVTKDSVASIEQAAQVGRDAGLDVQVSGSAASLQEPPGGTSELIGLGVAAIVLMLTFGSAVAAGLPLITAVVGVVIGSSLISLATGFMDLGSSTPTLAVMIGLAVAIDYSLFIVSRFRHELSLVDIQNKDSRAQAAGRAVGTAGSAVVFAGLTVVIALLALRVVGIGFLTDMGSAAALTVVIAVLIALTLLPAILSLFGTKVFAGKIKWLTSTTSKSSENSSTLAKRYAAWVTRMPLLPLVAGVAVLGLVAIPMTGIKLALPSDATAEPGSPARLAYELIDKGFGPGRNGPLIVVVDARGANQQPQPIFDLVVQKISALPDVVNAQLIAKNQEGDTAQLLVTPAQGPSSSSTKDLLQTLRDSESEIVAGTGGHYGITGQTALETDVSDTLLHALAPYLAVVVGLAFILLMLVFRSLLVPLTATLGFLLSVVATFGATVAIFQEGWLGIISNPQPLVSFLPIFLIGVVFGLAMDYQVFLVSRMREEYVHGLSAKEAVISGFDHSSRVVTAAALIMTAVFSSFILEDNSFIKSIGFALAAAVLFDAFVVRMVIIPSVMALFGDAMWYLPKWLDKILPNVDVEGEKLRTQLDTGKEELDDLPEPVLH